MWGMAPQQTPDVFANFLNDLDHLQVHRSREGEAKKKPLLLLLVISRIHHGQLRENRIHFKDVERDLGLLILSHGGRDFVGGPKPEQPFSHLRTAGFWKVHLPQGMEFAQGRTLSVSLLRRNDVFAELDNNLFTHLIGNAHSRLQAASFILRRWWTADEARQLAEALGLAASEI
jgi:predicted restriction endonuclease